MLITYCNMLSVAVQFSDNRSRLWFACTFYEQCCIYMQLHVMLNWDCCVKACTLIRLCLPFISYKKKTINILKHSLLWWIFKCWILTNMQSVLVHSNKTGHLCEHTKLYVYRTVQTQNSILRLVSNKSFHNLMIFSTFKCHILLFYPFTRQYSLTTRKMCDISTAR